MSRGLFSFREMVRREVAENIRRRFQLRDWCRAETAVKAEHNLNSDTPLPEEYRGEVEKKAYSLWQARGGNDEPKITVLTDDAMQKWYPGGDIFEIAAESVSV
jgi:hypothetical protein